MFEEDKRTRIRKKVILFFIWFFPNWYYFLDTLMSPVFYEPSPVIPAELALAFTLPVFIILSIIFTIILILPKSMIDKI